MRGFWEDLKTLVTSPIDLYVGLTNAGCPPNQLPYKAPGEKMKCVPGPVRDPQTGQVRDWRGTSAPDPVQQVKDYYKNLNLCPLFSKRDEVSQECVINWSSVALAGAVIIGGLVVLKVLK